MVFIPPIRQFETCTGCGHEFSRELSSCPRCGRLAGWRAQKTPLRLVIRRDGDEARRSFGSGCVGVIVLAAVASGAIIAALA